MSLLFFKDTALEVMNNIEKKKYLQKVNIIKHLYIEGAMSNADICTRFNISAPKSVGLINELISEGLVQKEGRGLSIGGRRPDLFGLQKNSFFILCINIDRYCVKVGLFNNNNCNITGMNSHIIELNKVKTSIEDICQFASEVIKSSGINQERIIGIGVSMPGLVDTTEGRSYTYLIPERESLKQILEARFQKPVFIENDTKVVSLAEHQFGVAQKKNNVLVIAMFTGTGLGIIIDGTLRRGSCGFAGEFGHIPLIPEGQLCHCGKRGCLETVASGGAMVRMALKGIKSGQNTILNQLKDQEGGLITPQLIIDAAIQGDQYAINIISEVGTNLGKGIATLVQIFNPELVVIAGPLTEKLTEVQHYLTTPIQHSLNIYCMSKLQEKTQVVISDLGENASMIGLVALVMENINKISLQN
ncbi:ROK family protein [Adhaeribacter aquaticus]|uniref:ROK family protein n=1 Tax=Adhaeribacter aquaticus TaxID=299567 RepID=UPI000479B720|nr:ROK family protein [Adhaeribacter aquaticus]